MKRNCNIIDSIIIDEKYRNKGYGGTLIKSVTEYIQDSGFLLCEKHNIEIEDCRKFINPIIKDKLEAEARRLNFLPRTNELVFE